MHFSEQLGSIESTEWIKAKKLNRLHRSTYYLYDVKIKIDFKEIIKERMYKH